MKFPLEWLSEYTKITNTNKEIGDIFTYLEFMQDGPIKDDIIDLEVRQNRPDALSVIGLATELSSKINSELKYPQQNDTVQFTKPNLLIDPQTNDQIKRFIAVKISGIKVSDSPDYIVQRLTKSGIRVVNNVVDITNYVMLEYGIPMHVFDADKLTENGKITLRMGKEGDTLETWIGEIINIKNTDIVITNSEKKVVSICGITGEKNSGASKNTNNIILEAANYDETLIRRSSLQHNLLTDAANRHNKILPSDMVEIAIRRACFLITEVCGGEIITAEDFYPIKQVRSEISFKISEINRLSGINIEKNKITEILTNLRYEIIDQTETNLNVISPRHRTDVTQSVDVIEDLLRIYGYDKIPEQPINLAPPINSTPKIYLYEDKVRDLLVQMGLEEHITEPLLKADDNTTRVILENSLNSEKNSLRISVVETLKPVINNYIKHKKNDIKIFEIGKIYQKIDAEFSETSVIGAIILTSNSYKTAKGIIDLLFLDLVGVNNYYLNRTDDKKNITLMVKEMQVGFIKNTSKDSIYFEIDLEKLINIDTTNNQSLITKIPFEHEQIFNLVVPKQVLYSEIVKIISSVVSEKDDVNILSNFIEEYTDTVMEKLNKKSYLISLKIQSLVGPVSKDDFKPIKEKALELLKTNLNIELK
jgi:phenylalanyl-tRNA synthetase beta chain